MADTELKRPDFLPYPDPFSWTEDFHTIRRWAKKLEETIRIEESIARRTPVNFQREAALRVLALREMYEEAIDYACALRRKERGE